MKKFLLLVAFSFAVCLAKSQTTQPTGKTNHSVGRTPISQAVPVVPGESATSSYDVNDEYLGQREKYVRMFSSYQLPLDFPKYNKSITIEDYDLQITSYLKAHSDMLTEKFRNKYSK